MNETNLLLKAYYEALYEHLEANRELLATRIEKLLKEEIVKREFGSFDEEKYTAYRDACLAFVDERLETYNPIGIQYTFDRIRAKEAVELELQLNWYDSRAEYEALVEAAHAKAEVETTEERMRGLTEELIKEVGAFPDGSIISAYEAEPALGKLPDYVVARAIEETVKF
jgi:DNA-binding Lrp family transcriptional regulator